MMPSMAGWVGEHTVCQNGSVSPLEQNANPSPEVGDGLPFRLSGVPCQAAAQLLHLPLSSHIGLIQWGTPGS